jgi:hypothetical protein
MKAKNKDAKVRELVFRAMNGHGGGGRSELRPENTVIDLILGGKEREKKEAIKCCKEVIRHIIHEWTNIKQGCEGFDQSAKVERICNVLDVTAPSALKKPTLKMLKFALEFDEIPQGSLSAVVRASIRYRMREKDAVFWLEIIERRMLCAYGYRALLKIDPWHPRVVDGLINLWRRSIEDGWSVNVVLLTKETIRVQGGKLPLILGLIELRKKSIPLYDSLLMQIKKEIDI